jgi:hypothetical protein
MVYYDTEGRLQLAREHAERLAEEMRHSRPLTADNGEQPGWARLGLVLARRVERLLRRRGHHRPAYGA